MPTCTFFGHRDCPDTIKPKLKETLIDLITNQGVDMFYVGHQGQFDAIVRSTLRELKKEYPQINYAVVLAYMPGKKNENEDYSDTMLPEGIETVYPRYAISWRNNWMLQQSDYVIACITHTWGGAYQQIEKAKCKKKTIVKIVLSQAFKDAYGASLRKDGQNVDFTAHTAVVTTAGNLKMYIPNQWFCAAAYTVEFIQVLLQYKKIIDEIISPHCGSAAAKKDYIGRLKNTDGVLANCGKDFNKEADDGSKTINFLGFSFDGCVVRIRPKTISKYYYRMYRKARGISKMRGYTPDGKRITGKNLYMSYLRKGAKEGHGNFLTYVDRAATEYGSNEAIRRDTKNHMQKIRRALKRN